MYVVLYMYIVNERIYGWMRAQGTTLGCISHTHTHLLIKIIRISISYILVLYTHTVEET